VSVLPFPSCVTLASCFCNTTRCRDRIRGASRASSRSYVCLIMPRSACRTDRDTIGSSVSSITHADIGNRASDVRMFSRTTGHTFCRASGNLVGASLTISTDLASRYCIIFARFTVKTCGTGGGRHSARGFARLAFNTREQSCIQLF